MPYDSASGAYIRRTTTILDETPDGDTVNTAVAVKLDSTADDAVTDLNHHRVQGGHYPAPSIAAVSRYLRQSPAGDVTWVEGVPIELAALKDLSNVPAGTTAAINITGNAATATSSTSASSAAACTGNAATATDMEVGHILAGKTTAAAVRDAIGIGRGFSAIKSTSQGGIAPATYTKVTFPVEEWDISGWYDSANSRFQPTEAGYYSITAQVQILSGLGAGAVTRLALYKNGALPSPVINVSDTYTISASDVQTFLLIADVYASGTDYFEIYVRSDGGSAKTISFGATFFRALKIS